MWFRTKKYEVQILLKDNSNSTRHEMLNDTTDWLIENFGYQFPRNYNIESGMIFKFRHEEDAMAFKLRWT